MKQWNRLPFGLHLKNILIVNYTIQKTEEFSCGITIRAQGNSVERREKRPVNSAMSDMFVYYIISKQCQPE
jgi:hypothetical protein